MIITTDKTRIKKGYVIRIFRALSDTEHEDVLFKIEILITIFRKN